MTDLSNKIQEHGLECPNCPGGNRRVHDRLIEQCPRCGDKERPLLGDLPEPVDWAPVKIEGETE